MARVHPLLDGVDTIGDHYRCNVDWDGLFESLYEKIRGNWLTQREPERWPTPDKNWVLRTAPKFTSDPFHRFEKQLQKQVAISLQSEGWGNDVPTASGLVDRNARQMNVDLAHQWGDGFELVEVKVDSDSPIEAALQILRYGAIYLLYRLEPDLVSRFKTHSMLRARWISLEVLAPRRYYKASNMDLRHIEKRLNWQVQQFVSSRATDLAMSFRFTAFPDDFLYAPGIEDARIRSAVHRRVAPSSNPVSVIGCGGEPIHSFADWERYALPAERKRHWKTGRSACELGRAWTANGEPRVPLEIALLLDSRCETAGTVIQCGKTEHETQLPFSSRGPRCHDLALQGMRDAQVITVCIEAKADESFGGTVSEELARARQRPASRFADRLEWLSLALLGVPAFADNKQCELSETIAPLPYQLFAAIAGTLLEARQQKAAVAVFIVHEFRTTATIDSKMDENARALNTFLGLLLSANNGAGPDFAMGNGKLVGPISMRKHSKHDVPDLPNHIPLFIGKIRTDLIVQ